MDIMMLVSYDELDIMMLVSYDDMDIMMLVSYVVFMMIWTS